MSKSNEVTTDYSKWFEVAKYDNLTTKSEKIRAMHRDGMSRGDIAKKLNIRYQHVRNVLITPVKKS